MNVISIDYSKYCTGIYISCANKEISTSIIVRKDNNHLKKIFSLIDEFIKEFKIDFGIIEDYPYGLAGSRSITIMAEICGIIKLAFVVNDIKYIMMPIKTWKFNTIGNHKKVKKTEKTDYLTIVKDFCGKWFETTDEADAYLMYFTLKKIAKRTKFLNKTEKEIKDNLKEIMEAYNENCSNSNCKNGKQ